jgi:hypothetical protein
MMRNIFCQLRLGGRIVPLSGLSPMTTLTPADHAALRAMQRAARSPRLKAAIAAYEHLRARGVDHQKAVEYALEYVLEDIRMVKPN